MSYDITKQKEVFRSKHGKNIIYEAVCDGEPCYCLEHIPSGRVALFDLDRRIYNLLRKDIDKRGAVTVYTNSGCCYFTIRIKGRNVPLSQYILLRHEKKSVYKTRNTKMVVNKANTSYAVDDLRRKNIYDTSKPIEVTPSRRVWSDGSRIYISLARSERPFITDYDPILLEMLQTPSICDFYIDRDTRGNPTYLVIGKNKTFSKIRLHIFVYLFFTKFRDYRTAKSFLAHLNDDRATLSNDNHMMDHFNGDTYNNCMWNLYHMSGNSNRCKGCLTQLFNPPYQVYGAIDHTSGECLIEYVSYKKSRLYKCSLDNEDELIDFLRVKMGRASITAKTKVSVIRQTDGVLHGCSIRTPKELSAANGHKRVQRDFSMDNSHAMELLRLNAEQPEAFIPLAPMDKRGIPIDQLADMLSAYFGSKVEATVTPADQSRK